MAGKRKRTDGIGDSEGVVVNGDVLTQKLETFQDWLVDILEILKTQDTTPSIFDRPIPSAGQTSHDTKRAKLAQTSEQVTIKSLIETRAYSTADEVVKDVEVATTGLIEELQGGLDGDQARYTSRESHTQIARAGSLKKELDKLIQKELIRRPDKIIISKKIKEEATEDDDTKFTTHSSADNALTLLSNNHPPKQLFTSLRKQDSSSRPLDELHLPNGITTTKITPQHSLNEDSKTRVPTFKDIFGPPSSLPPLTMPKQSRHTATRSSSVNWYNPTETESKAKPNRHNIHPNQAMPTGQWLKYNVAPSPTQLASPETKRKQRDRALSGGEAQTALSQETIESHNKAKEDALFRSVYSSFAPSHDDYGALVPTQQKNKIWWKKYGEARYEEILGLRDDGIELETMNTDEVLDEEPLDMKELEAAVRNWQPEDPAQEMQGAKPPRKNPPESESEVDELLEDISDLIETLHSHQRIRNLTLTNNARPNTANSPTSPSEAECAVYDTLKDQLTLIVSTLPPYLLSKLDGDKLGELKVSTRVPVELPNQKGVLEESEASIAAKRAAAPVAAPTAASQTPNHYSNVPGRNSSYLQASTPAQQYPRTGYGASTAPRPGASSSYLQNPQYSNRPAAPNYSASATRPSYPVQGGYPPQGAAASTPRYNYNQSYAQQSQTSYGGYQNGYRPYSGQNMNNYSYNGHLPASQARTPSNNSAAQVSQAYRGTQSEYQQRAVPPQGYGYGASPQTQYRPPFNTQTSQGSIQRPPLHQHHSSQYQSSTLGSPQVNGTASNGSPALPAKMTSDEQSTAMDKSKVHLEQQNGQGPGTPQTGSGQYTAPLDGGQQNGTPVPQQNGVAA
ncbi:hypothetical protein ACLMJK_000046 [Lecanora helva]